MLLRHLDPVSRTALREDLMRHVDDEGHTGIVFSLQRGGAFLTLRLPRYVVLP